MKHWATALLLLCVFVTHNSVHKIVPWPIRGHAFTITGHMALAVVLCLLMLAYRSRAIIVVGLLALGYVGQVAGCNALWLYEPWPVTPDGELCSDKVGWPMGLLGAYAAVTVLAWLMRHRK